MFLSFYCIFMIHCHLVSAVELLSFLLVLTKDRKAPWALSFFYILSNKARPLVGGDFFSCFLWLILMYQRLYNSKIVFW